MIPQLQLSRPLIYQKSAFSLKTTYTLVHVGHFGGLDSADPTHTMEVGVKWYSKRGISFILLHDRVSV